ncbi:uncharacterized protein LOC106662340 isoform X2 [Cimex lectularius]|uniref:EDR1/CTR1/ARMC3-like peptidase-like domain-containing protein n=1 Tax=Cimex lectularius TaxID=79782 RepID=A0A8I6R9R9_CIMLE|nr:uncharacterized protein LOC106662340 isoform X2 [Cimex lectularius]
MSRKSVTRKSVARKSVARKSTTGGKRQSMARRSSTKQGGGGSKKSGLRSTSIKKLPHQFEEADLTIPELGPFFVLLKCKEPPLIIRAIDTIYDYIKRVPEVVPYVLSKNTIAISKVYAQGQLQYIPLRALKLIAELSQNPDSHEDIKTDDIFLRFLVKSYGENGDAKWKEASSKILTEITQDLEFCRTFVDEYCDMSQLIKMLKHLDPDVVYNSLVVGLQYIFYCYTYLICIYFQLVKNFFRDKSLAEKFVNCPEFMFDKFFPLFESQYIEIQKLSLQLVHWLVYQPETEDLKKLFIDEGGIDKIYNILLNKYAWRDIHPLVIDILQASYNNEERVASLKEDGIKKLVGYLEFIEDDELVAKAMNVIVQWSARIYGKWMLLRLGMLPKCCSYLLDGTIPMKLVACQFINEVALEREKLRKLVQHVNIPALAGLIIDVSNPNELVLMAHTLFNNLIKFSRFEIAVHCTKSPLKDDLVSWMKENYHKMSPDNKRLILNTISILAQNNVVRAHFIDFALIDFLCKALQDPNENLYDVTIVAGEALEYLIKTEPNACQYLFLNEGLQTMKHVLWTTKNQTLREKLCHCMMEAISHDEYLKLQLLKNDHLNWLVKHKAIWYESPSMKTTVEEFYKYYLPAKIAFTSRLGFEDKIKDGFYVFKENRPPNTLPLPFTMEDIEDLSVYIVGFEKNRVLQEIHYEQEMEIRKKQIQNEECINLLKEFPEKSSCHPLGYSLMKDKNYINKTNELTICWERDEDLNSYLTCLNTKIYELDQKELVQLKEVLNAPNLSMLQKTLEPFPTLKVGEPMRRYTLSTVRNALARAMAKLPKRLDLLSTMPVKVTEGQGKRTKLIIEPPLPFTPPPEEEKIKIPPILPKPFGASWAMKRAQIIAEIVFNEMSGPENNDPCTYHTFNLYLAELKNKLNSNVIPLGMLKVGMKLERALLFKVLADKIEVPCTLVGGNKGQWWNELCIMELNEDCKGIADMPKSLMYPTHVIDLWMRPGNLMAIGSKEANLYCGSLGNPQTYTREDWMTT